MVLKETVYDRFLRLKDLVKDKFDGLDDQKFYKIISRLATWHYPKKRWKDMTLSREEAKIYEWLLNNSHNPDTVYKWYRVLGFNKTLQDEIKKLVPEMKGYEFSMFSKEQKFEWVPQ